MLNNNTKQPFIGGLTAQVGRLGLRVGGHPALSLHSSNEPGELSQWPWSWGQHHKHCRWLLLLLLLSRSQSSPLCGTVIWASAFILCNNTTWYWGNGYGNDSSLQANIQPNSLVWSLGWWPPGAELAFSKGSQWNSRNDYGHDNSTKNIISITINLNKCSHY